MMWLIPRSNPGALTEYWRPNDDGVSVERGALLPYGAYPRLFMLWMYAECARAEQRPPEQINPMLSIRDFMSEVGLDAMEVPALFGQAYRLFASRFRAGDRVMLVIKESVLRRARATTVRASDPASHHSKELAYGAAFRQEMAGRRFQPCMHTLHALRHCPVALDAYLWDACYGERAFPGAPSRSRLAVYHALAERPSRSPSVSEVLAFERGLATLRQKRLSLEEEAGTAPHEEASFL